MVWTRFQTWFLVCSCLSDTVCSGKSQSPRALTDFPPKRVNKLQNVSQKVLFPSNVQQYPPGGRNKELWLTTRYSGLFFSRHPTYSGSQVWCLHAGQDSKGFVVFFSPPSFFRQLSGSCGFSLYSVTVAAPHLYFPGMKAFRGEEHTLSDVCMNFLVCPSL